MSIQQMDAGTEKASSMAFPDTRKASIVLLVFGLVSVGIAYGASELFMMLRAIPGVRIG